MDERVNVKILNGKIVKEALAEDLKVRVSDFTLKNKRRPKLCIVQVGDRQDSNVYVASKINFGKKLGFDVDLIKMNEGVSTDQLIQVIEEKNFDESVDGIIVQLPLPTSIDKEAVLGAIKKEKDADGLSGGGDESVTPATARGVFELLKFYKVETAGLEVVIIGRSKLVGTPLAQLALKNGAKVTVCNSLTKDVPVKSKHADILMVAIGKSRMIDASYVKEGAVVIDIGINRGVNNEITGDVDFESVSKIASAITPVPYGVGQMTVLALFQNVMDLGEKVV